MLNVYFPEDTVIVTVVPTSTGLFTSDFGFWLITLPAGVVLLGCAGASVTFSFAPLIASFAAASVSSTTFGTATWPKF